MNFFRYILIVLIVTSCASQVKPNLVDAEMETTVKENLSYYLYYPDDYLEKPEKEYPILLFLHGGGESGR